MNNLDSFQGSVVRLFWANVGRPRTAFAPVRPAFASMKNLWSCIVYNTFAYPFAPFALFALRGSHITKEVSDD